MAFVTLDEKGFGADSNLILTASTEDLLVINDASSDIRAEIVHGALARGITSIDDAGGSPSSVEFNHANTTDRDSTREFLTGSSTGTTTRALTITMVGTTGDTLGQTLTWNLASGSNVSVTGNEVVISPATATGLGIPAAAVTATGETNKGFDFEVRTNVYQFEVDAKSVQVINNPATSNANYWISEARTHHGTGRDNGKQVHLFAVKA